MELRLWCPGVTHFHHSTRGQRQEYKFESLVETSRFLFSPSGKPPLLQPVYNAQVMPRLQTLAFHFYNLTEISQFLLLFWFGCFWGFFCFLGFYINWQLILRTVKFTLSSTQLSSVLKQLLAPSRPMASKWKTDEAAVYTPCYREVLPECFEIICIVIP